MTPPAVTEAVRAACDRTFPEGNPCTYPVCNSGGYACSVTHNNAFLIALIAEAMAEGAKEEREGILALLERQERIAPGMTAYVLQGDRHDICAAIRTRASEGPA